MDKTYVFSNEPSSGCCGGSKLDITALLPNLMGGRSLDPNLLLALNNGYRNQDMWGGAGIWWIWILLLFGWGRNGFGGWKQPNLQSQFHITKVQNSFDILKYLKEIIMLNSTKEGIVVQFLPEAKDFGVSLNQVL